MEYDLLTLTFISLLISRRHYDFVLLLEIHDPYIIGLRRDNLLLLYVNVTC